MDLRNLRGVVPTLSTVMTSGGEIDEGGMRSLVRFSIEKGASGLGVGMVAGEFYKLSDEERRLVMRTVVDEADGRVPVLVGTSHSGTEPAIELSRYARDVGADGIIVMPPYFMKGEAGAYVYEHYSRIASAVDLPLMVQDAEEDIFVPIPVSFYPRIAREFSNVYMAKVESLDPLTRMGEILEVMGDGMHVYGAKSIVEELSAGASGHVPSSGMTDLVVRLFREHESGVDAEASGSFARYRLYLALRARHPLLSANIEKEILRLRGVIGSSYVRGPRQEMTEEVRDEVMALLAQTGVVGE